MAKIVGGKFSIAWDLPADPDVAATVLYFGDTPEGLGYDSPSQEVAAPKYSFSFPADASEGFIPPVAEDKTFVALACRDQVGNLSDLTVALPIPFDLAAPAAPINLRLS